MRAIVSAFSAVLALSATGCVTRPLELVTADPTGTDSWEFIQSRPASILFVVDNSGSMCEEQANLRANFQDFIDAFTAAAPGARFKMGVVTTDTLDPNVAGRLNNVPLPSSGGTCDNPPPPLDCVTGLPDPLPKWVDETTPDLARTFGCLASVGVAGYGGETALGAARMALSPALLTDPGGANYGFYEPGSLLVIVFLGDEDDCSVCSGTTCGPLPNLQANLDCAINRVDELTPVADFVSYVSSLSNGLGRTVGDSGLYVAAIIGLDQAGSSEGPVLADPSGADQLLPICSIAGQGSAAPAPRIEAFTRAAPRFLETSICDADFGSELGVLGYEVGTIIRAGCLRHAPCPGTTAREVVVRVREYSATGEETVRELVPLVDYDVVCATPPEVCSFSTDAACPDGWRVEFITEVPPAAEVQVLYGFDAGDGCSS